MKSVTCPPSAWRVKRSLQPGMPARICTSIARSARLLHLRGGILVSRPSTLDSHVRVRATYETYPAADVVDFARPGAEHIVRSLDRDGVPSGFEFLAGPATAVIPQIVAKWLGS